VVGGLVAAAAAAVVFAANRSTPTWDIGTPAGTVQAYVSAVVGGNTAAAARYLDPQGACDAGDLDRGDVADVAGVQRVDLTASRIFGDSASVEVAITYSTQGAPLDTGSTQDSTLHLARAGDTWVIVGTPWPLYGCGGGVK